MKASPAAPLTVAAVDLGAESGRVVRVDFDGERLTERVQGRFPNTPSVVDGALRWDLQALWTSIQDLLGALGEEVGGGRGADGTTSAVASVGVDTWGVDYGLLDGEGLLLDRPTCYRDPRRAEGMAQAVAAVGRERLFSATGSQVHQINTVYALVADAATPRLERARTLLMMPDVVHHLLSGSRVTEHTAASTTGIYDTARRRWATDLVEDLGLPTRLLPQVVDAGTDLGAVVGDLGRGPLAGTRVVAPAGHDTASAVVATPFVAPGSLFLSSGTWSLIGVERADPVVDPAAMAAGLTNEGGYAGTVQLLRTVVGLGLLAECRRQWAREGLELSYAELAELAGREPVLRSLIDPDAPEFLAPGDVPARVRAYCARTGSPVPEGPGAVARCVVDSLALVYRAAAADIAAVTGQRPPAVSVTGGGANHALLAQATADATGLPVHCGPVEATALGNAGVQLVALGELGGLDDVRAVVAATTALRSFTPQADPRWEEAAERLRLLRSEDERRRGLVST